MLIRRATHADIDSIIDMGAMFYARTSYASITGYCVDSARKLAEMMIDSGVMLVADSGAGLYGMAGLLIGPFHFNHAAKMAFEVMWWVTPAAQGAGIGQALFDAIEPACREQGCVAFQMMTLHDSPPHAALLYERGGMRHSETCYTKVL